MRCAKCLKQYPSSQLISTLGTQICLDCTKKQRETGRKLTKWVFGVGIGLIIIFILAILFAISFS